MQLLRRVKYRVSPNTSGRRLLITKMFIIMSKPFAITFPNKI
jgi:hypothetical protein